MSTKPDSGENKHAKRKATPVFSGVIMYFPDAINAIAQCSKAGNDQHNPNTPLHWDRAKSGDELDACMRHLMEAGTMDDDGIRHSTKAAWRALANLQKELERVGGAVLSEHNDNEATLLEQSDYGEGIDDAYLTDSAMSYIKKGVPDRLTHEGIIHTANDPGINEGIINNGIIDGTKISDILLSDSQSK